MNNPIVLIVGAGPTGMLLALVLTRYGIPVRIIDQRNDIASGSKALTINPLTLSILDNLDLANSIINIGNKTKRLNVYYENKRISAVNMALLDSNTPYYIMLPQPRTEQVIADALIKAGCKVEYGTKLINIIENPSSVTATIRRNNATDEVHNYSFVVGCDGSHSTIRESLNVDFPGYNYDMHFILGDLRLNWNKPLDQGHYFVQPNGFLIILPLGNGYHRIVGMKRRTKIVDKTPSLDEFQSLIKEYKVQHLEIYNLIWSSSSLFYNRLADNYGSKRVFLAGDACHSFSPLGGFGMNTGIGDVYNLGWKLFYTLKGYTNTDLLKSYGLERRFIATQLIKQTDLTTSLISRLDRHNLEDESKWLPTMSNRENIKNRALQASGMSQSYSLQKHHKFDNNLCINYYLPFLHEIKSISQNSSLTNGFHTLIYFMSISDISHRLSIQKLVNIKSLFPEFNLIVITNQLIDEHPSSIDVVFDKDNKLQDKLGIKTNTTFLVRPDFYVEFIANCNDDLDKLANHLINSYKFKSHVQDHMRGTYEVYS